MIMTTDNWLDKFGSEYRIKMEDDRQRFFLDVLVKICDLFKCTKQINELTESFPVIKFLEAFYNAGFYKGLGYGIETGQNYVINDADIPIKYGQEVADEINQEILESTMQKY